MERLREHLHQHNQWVLALTLLTFVAAVILWALLYFFVVWISVFMSAAIAPIDYHPPKGEVLGGFIIGAVVLCAVAWIVRRLHPNEIPEDNKGLGGHLLDLLLAVPRVTLSIFGNSGAAARLTDEELGHAWHLLRRMDEAENPVPMQMLPVDIPDGKMREKIILTLQVANLIEIRPTSTGPVLVFRNKEARQLTQERVRLRV